MQALKRKDRKGRSNPRIYMVFLKEGVSPDTPSFSKDSEACSEYCIKRQTGRRSVLMGLT
jgi:hypothetical protein